MLKKLFISFLACFTLVFTTVGGYAQATTGNPALDTLMRINKALFATVATGLAGSAAIGIKAKEIYDDNKQAVYDGALKAYDTMSESAKQSWASAVERGRTGADMASEIWDSLTNVITDVFSSHSKVSDLPSYEYENQVWKFSQPITVQNDFFRVNQKVNEVEISVTTQQVTYYFRGITVLDGFNENTFLSPYFNDDINGEFIKKQIEGKDSFQSVVNTLNQYLSPIYKLNVNGGGSVAIDPIYDQALKRALETDIPRMKDAGMVIPQAELTTPAGTRINLDANTGTMTLPDGTLWTGNADDLKIGIPDAIINNGDAVWSNGQTDTNVWTGERTNTATGEGVDTGQTVLDRILEGVEGIPENIGTILTKLFVPVTIASAWADITATLQDRLRLPDFGWLVTDGIVCTESGKDVRITFNGETTTFVDMSWLYSVRSFYMPIMRGFLWFLFGWYVYRKAIAITNKVDGIEK